jgi:hypothetical protein
LEKSAPSRIRALAESKDQKKAALAGHTTIPGNEPESLS